MSNVRKSKKESPTKSHRVIVRRVSTIPTEGLVIVEDESTGKGYIAPIGTEFKRGTAKLVISKLTPAYMWEKEIEAMLPDIEVMKTNIRRSIWYSGGYDKNTGRKSRRLNQAWPYRLPE